LKVILATHNKDKRKEISQVFTGLKLDILSLDTFPQVGEIIENGTTIEENALIKAREVYRITGYPAISDDTGLEVDALDGKPGIYAARYAGENCSYSDNVNKLIYVMKNISLIDRTATFHTVMAFVDGKTELVADGFVKGLINETPRGDGGFGYDPIFYYPEMDKTFAEMSLKEKGSISHRGNAIRHLKKKMKIYLSSKKQIFSKEHA
jgi:XTP/dITP diphosphohydrolase